ncbi:FecR family protein [Sphingomonas oryzagri]
MTDDQKSHGDASGRSQIIEEASVWCARMHGPEADDYRQAFAAWLALGAVHRQIYSEVCELHGYAGTVRGDDVHPDGAAGTASAPSTRDKRRPPRLTPLFVAGSIGLAAAIGFHFWQPTARILSPSTIQTAEVLPLQLQTALGEKHAFRLKDGSVVTLDTDSLVTVAFDPDRRELRLEHGRARFEVAHEPRPFVVNAGTGSIVAHGTIFDVSITSDQTVHVHLFRGAIDVRTPDVPLGSGKSPMTRITPGESIAYRAGSGPLPEVARTDITAPDWPKGMIPFSGTPLSEVIEDANRYSSVKIMLTDPALGSLPVSGTLRIDDIHMLARTVAHQLQLRVDDRPDSILLSAPQ